MNKCIVSIIGNSNIDGKTFIDELLKQSSYNEHNLYGYYNNWNIYEDNYGVNIEIREYTSFDQFFNETNSNVNYEKEVVLFLVENHPKGQEKFKEQFWLSEINQRSPNAILLLVSFLNQTSNLLRLERLRSINTIIRDVFEAKGFSYNEFLILAKCFKQILLNEFTDRLDFVKEKIRINLLNRDLRLDIGNCYLTSLSEIPQIFECNHLEVLILSNEWAEYDNGKWHRIPSKNNGGRNILRYLSKGLNRLSQLKKLIIGGDWDFGEKNLARWSIYDIQYLKNFSKLEYLNVSNNEIRSFPALNRLRNLKVLHINNNNINKISSLKSLEKIEELYLSNNYLEDITFLSELENLKTIDLHSNNIKDITSIENLIVKIDISNSKWEPNKINIAANPLETPPLEIINTGQDAVLTYFRDIKLDTPYINDEIKVILVGNSEVGKTTLAKYLDNERDLKKVHPFTLWMNEKHIESKYKVKGLKCKINLFDFGGHDFYHDTHHLLFGTNAFYIILWDKKTNHLNYRTVIQKINEKEIKSQVQDYPLKYWLDSVQHFSKGVESENFDFEVDKSDGYSSLALVIQNKVNSNNEIQYLENKSLNENYPFIFNFLNISIINSRKNLEYFDSVFTEMLEQSQIIGAKLPGYYGIIKKALENYKGEKILTIADFKDYCNTKIKSKIDINQTRFLTHYLKQLGIVLFYPKGEDSDKVFITKKWIIESIYKAFENLQVKRGEFNYNYLIEKLKKDLTLEEINSFIELLIEFKIIFKHPTSDLFIAPLYLPNAPSNNIKMFIEEGKIPYRRFFYNGFIHKNITLSLFQKYGEFALAETKDDITSFFYYWKNGLIIKDPKTSEIVLIKFFIGDNDGNAFIDIVKLNKIKRSIFTDDLINFIKGINGDYDIEEMVTLDGKNFISLEILNNNAKAGKLIFTERCKLDLEKQAPKISYYNLKDYKMFLENGIKRKKVVISYSKKDLTRVHTFIRYLRPLIDLELIEEPWYCTLANPGDVWDEKIKANFEEADIVFFMISEYFYSTTYIVEKEIKSIIDRYIFDKSVKIVPIILEHYDWERKAPYNLKDFSAMPFQAKPISDFNNEKLAWNTITSAVRKMIEKDLDPGHIDFISKEMQEFYERQIEGKLNKNS